MYACIDDLVCVCVVCVFAGLHPLQRALLIQQKIQQHPPHQTPPTAPPTAIPHHMTGGAPPSHSGSPIVQSPAPLTPGTPGGGGGAPPVYSISMVPNPMTPLQQGVFALPAGGTPASFDPSILAAQSQQPVLTSQVLQKVVSKLAYLGTSTDLMRFPEVSGLDKQAALPGGSQVNQELVERELGVLWLRHQEHLSKQVSPYSAALVSIVDFSSLKKSLELSMACGASYV